MWRQVYMQKGRLLLSLQAVKQALKLGGPTHPDVHRLVVRFCAKVQLQQQQQQEQQQQQQQQQANGNQVSIKQAPVVHA